MAANKYRALFVGLNTIDMQFFVEGFPCPNSKTKAHRNEIASGGPATNAAIVCAALGVETTLLSPIGKHSLSRFLTDDIVKHGVKLIDPIDNIESKPVFASIITDEINGERTVFSYHPENEYEHLLNELNIENFEDFDIALFDGFYPDLAIPIAKKLKSLNIPTVLDGGSWKPGLDQLLPYIDIAICSNDFSTPFVISRDELIESLQQLGVQHIAITRGEKSILSNTSGKTFNIEVPKVDVVDTLGAGDFFHGAFCCYFATGMDFTTALRKAGIVAAESCRFHGTRSLLKQTDIFN
jgi:sugar/nucleoside kinase (ribokinase family)